MPGLNNNLVVPDFQVRINGRDLPSAAVMDLSSVIVHDDVEAPGMFSLRLLNWDMLQLRMTWVDDDLFAVGNAVEIAMGYVDNLTTLITGEITGLEPEFCANEPPIVTVRGYDRRHRLLRGRKTRSFVKVKDSAIASQIASEAGLAAGPQIQR